MVENLFYDKLPDTEIDKYFGGTDPLNQLEYFDLKQEFLSEQLQHQ
ncbi:hypothetical protein ABIE50_002396 [Chitinophaga sp. OAE865]